MRRTPNVLAFCALFSICRFVSSGSLKGHHWRVLETTQNGQMRPPHHHIQFQSDEVEAVLLDNTKVVATGDDATTIRTIRSTLAAADFEEVKLEDAKEKIARALKKMAKAQNDIGMAQQRLEEVSAEYRQTIRKLDQKCEQMRAQNAHPSDEEEHSSEHD